MKCSMSLCGIIVYIVLLSCFVPTCFAERIIYWPLTISYLNRNSSSNDTYNKFDSLPISKSLFFNYDVIQTIPVVKPTRMTTRFRYPATFSNLHRRYDESYAAEMPGNFDDGVKNDDTNPYVPHEGKSIRKTNKYVPKVKYVSTNDIEPVTVESITTRSGRNYSSSYASDSVFGNSLGKRGRLSRFKDRIPVTEEMSVGDEPAPTIDDKTLNKLAWKRARNGALNEPKRNAATMTTPNISDYENDRDFINSNAATGIDIDNKKSSGEKLSMIAPLVRYKKPAEKQRKTYLLQMDSNTYKDIMPKYSVRTKNKVNDNGGRQKFSKNNTIERFKIQKNRPRLVLNPKTLQKPIRYFYLNDQKQSATDDSNAHKENADKKPLKGIGQHHAAGVRQNANKKKRKKYKVLHRHSKAKKGRKKKANKKKKYLEEMGKKKKQAEKGGRFQEQHKGVSGKKEVEFKEVARHKKGHSTKGSHEVHKKDEYVEKNEFYDEHHDGDERDKFNEIDNTFHNAKGEKHKNAHNEGDFSSAHNDKHDQKLNGKHELEDNDYVKDDDYQKINQNENQEDYKEEE